MWICSSVGTLINYLNFVDLIAFNCFLLQGYSNVFSPLDTYKLSEREILGLIKMKNKWFKYGYYQNVQLLFRFLIIYSWLSMDNARNRQKSKLCYMPKQYTFLSFIFEKGSSILGSNSSLFCISESINSSISTAKNKWYIMIERKRNK